MRSASFLVSWDSPEIGGSLRTATPPTLRRRRGGFQLLASEYGSSEKFLSEDRRTGRPTAAVRARNTLAARQEPRPPERQRERKDGTAGRAKLLLSRDAEESYAALHTGTCRMSPEYGHNLLGWCRFSTPVQYPTANKECPTPQWERHANGLSTRISFSSFCHLDIGYWDCWLLGIQIPEEPELRSEAKLAWNLNSPGGTPSGRTSLVTHWYPRRCLGRRVARRRRTDPRAGRRCRQSRAACPYLIRKTVPAAAGSTVSVPGPVSQSGRAVAPPAPVSL